MIPDSLRDNPLAAALRAMLATAAKFELGELTLEIAPAKIVEALRLLKYDQKFVRLSTVTGVDRYPAEPRFEVVYHLHSVERKERLRLKCAAVRARIRRSNRSPRSGARPTGTSAKFSTCSASAS